MEPHGSTPGDQGAYHLKFSQPSVKNKKVIIPTPLRLGESHINGYRFDPLMNYNYSSTIFILAHCSVIAFG